MGMVFGKLRVETPKFEVKSSTADYEIREYPPSVVAEITYEPTEFKGDKDGGFGILAKYIGAFGNPQNTKPEKIAMTTPVITKAEKIAMTTPVVTKGNEERVTMQFTLPEKYSKAEEAPKPVDERVVVTEEGEKKYAVVDFNGVASEGVVKEKVEKLKKDLERDGVKICGADFTGLEKDLFVVRESVLFGSDFAQSDQKTYELASIIVKKRMCKSSLNLPAPEIVYPQL